MLNELGFRGRGEDDRDALRNPLPGEEADGRPTSLLQKPRELSVESRVPGNERDRAMSHRTALTVKYRIYLAAAVPVCLHCGQLAPDGGLFCAKCGFTLPQVDGLSTSASPVRPSTAEPPPPVSPIRSSPLPASSAVPPAPPMASAAIPAAAYTVGPSTPGAPPPQYLTRMQPPSNGKYCIRCGTLISRPAVYCPVCQQPQGP